MSYQSSSLMAFQPGQTYSIAAPKRSYSSPALTTQWTTSSSRLTPATRVANSPKPAIPQQPAQVSRSQYLAYQQALAAQQAGTSLAPALQSSRLVRTSQPSMAKEPEQLNLSIIPDNQSIRKRLGLKEAIVQGVQKGLVAGSVLTLPLFALQYFLRKPSYTVMLLQPFFKGAANTAKKVDEPVAELAETAVKKGVDQLEDKAKTALSKVDKEDLKGISETLVSVNPNSFDAQINTYRSIFKAQKQAMKESFTPLRDQIAETGLKANLGNLFKEFGISALETLFFGASLGTGIALLDVGDVKNKLIGLNEATGKAPKAMDSKVPVWLGGRKPVTDPTKTLAELNQTELNEQEAFGNGVKKTLLIKLGLGTLTTIPLLLPLLYLQGKPLFKAALQEAKQTPDGNQLLNQGKALWKASKASSWLQWKQFGEPYLAHPLPIAKLIILPLMGGWIAKDIVPWMRGQLGLSNSSVNSAV